MALHHGETIEKIIRKNGHSISEVATRLNVNRRSIYNWFTQPILRQEIIHKIGKAIMHDFSVEFPGLFTPADFIFDTTPTFSLEKYNKQFNPGVEEAKSVEWRDKYLDLLEKYNNLLEGVYLKEKLG